MVLPKYVFLFFLTFFLPRLVFASLYLELGYSPFFSMSSQQPESATRRELYFGGGGSALVGWKFSSYRTFLVFESMDLQYRFDTTEKQAKILGLAVGGSAQFFEYFSGGLIIGQNQQKTEVTGGDTVEYQGLSLRAFADGRYFLTYGLYAMFRLSFVFPGKLNPRNNNTEDSLEVSGQSLEFGVGYQF